MCRGLRLDVPQGITTNTPSIPGHAYPRDWRRRSADIGGLHLALATSAAMDYDQPEAGLESRADSWVKENNSGTLGTQGQGWMGGEPGAIETLYAELLSDMYTQTVNSVKDNSLTSIPPSTPEHVRSRLIHDLNRWNFEPHRLDEEEVTACTLILFETLFRIDGMREAIPISMEQITSFVHHLRKIYRYENTYHNFEHALDVLQATQSYLKSAGIVPPPTFLLEPVDRKWTSPKSVNDGKLLATLGHRELFILYVAAIGHDVGHPGFTNNFMKNAKTPLSMIFDHNSALENMHCQLLLRVMRYHGLGVLLDDPQHGNHMRKVLVQSVLATDMGIHNDFMIKLKAVIDGEKGSLCMRQIILCQAILKNADISNPARPFLVSRHWASMLMQEWTAQANLEEEFQMQPTVMSSSDPLKEANSQIFFIQTFVKPLLDLTERAMPSMAMYVTHCKANLKTWIQKRKAILAAGNTNTGPSVTTISSSASSSSSSIASSSSASVSQLATSPPPVSPRQFDSYHTAFPLTLPTYHPPSDRESTNGSRSERDQDSVSVPDSPTESVVSSSAIFSPVGSEVSGSHRYPSTASNSNSISNHLLNVPAPHAAIRAATKVGSLRKKSQTNLNEIGTGIYRKSRNSWCASPNSAGGISSTFVSMFQPNSISIDGATKPSLPLTMAATPNSPTPSSTSPSNEGTSPSPSPTITRPLQLQVSP